MSGGVDSSVSALLLKETGEDAIGVSMQVWDYRQNGGCDSKATCCSPDDFTDARMVAAKIGLPYYVFDFEESFREKVIDNFVETYKQGKTPNPCVDCNNKVKFRELRQRAKTLGCGKVATGHFAQVEKSKEGYRLIRGKDENKDQTYFLYGTTQEELGDTIFPVGHLTKAEVRELAKEAGLVTAEKPESQDICFVQGSVKDFLVKIGGKVSSGEVVNSSGEILGSHDGITAFTVGQRKGLGINTNEPFYVIEIDRNNNRVIVGPKHELEREGFLVNEINWINPEIYKKVKNEESLEFEAIAQLRYRHKGVRVRVRIKDFQNCEVRFLNEWSTVSPGQAAVFYDLENREVLGGGRLI